ncbi:NUDIX family hydrolase [Ceratobasidium sp. AG-Ba]|nr:NUDIX family hydrolase [Ceratobasidium sp. AG-Ba]
MSGISSKFLGLRPPRSTSPYLSLTTPFTRNTLSSLKKRLNTVREAYPPEQIWPVPVNAASEEDKRARAAVLLPICNVNNQPGLLLELRGKLRNHGGEVRSVEIDIPIRRFIDERFSFPGGKIDQADASHIAAALRETEEELGIDPSQIEILGALAPPQISLRGLRVYPYVGFVRPKTRGITDNDSLDDPLPSLEMSSLRPSLPEVPFAFHLPFSEIIESRRLRAHEFRGQRPYWTVDVTDKVAGIPDLTWTSGTGIDEIGGSDQPGKLQVWGLTGWYINVLMHWLEVYH